VAFSIGVQQPGHEIDYSLTMYIMYL